MDQEDLSLSGVMSEMDPELLAFLRKIDSFVKWDLISFFYDNPHTTDTAENVARYAGRNAETTKAELAELAKSGILLGNQLGDMTVYSLPHDPKTKELIRRFVESLDDRQFRVKAIYHIIHHMR
ncbi:MAG: hypothetical protein JXD18_06400 [Anaerolineae bacterium]|nr:hypothetical protein [Anaerolineae bacterium]